MAGHTWDESPQLCVGHLGFSAPPDMTDYCLVEANRAASAPTLCYSRHRAWPDAASFAVSLRSQLQVIEHTQTVAVAEATLMWLNGYGGLARATLLWPHCCGYTAMATWSTADTMPRQYPLAL